ncbi:MAG: amidohydrolase family protein [Planctomycetaceae bacterium]|nr:amidohydrolase family protein [Planctomycetaceae bacterium]
MSEANPAASIQANRDASKPLFLVPKGVLTPDGIQEGFAVVVQDNKFVAVGPADALAKEYATAERVDLPERLIMPGFIDSHQHLAQAFGKGLAYGEPSEIFKRVWVPMEGFLNEELVHLSGKLAAFEALRGGFTTISDAGARNANDLGLLADAVEEVGIRCVLGFICNDFPNAPTPPDQEVIVKNAQKHLDRFGKGLVTPSLAVSIPEIASDKMLGTVYRMCEESGRVFQTHVNEHLVAVERSIVDRKLRPLEHLVRAGALGPATLAAHATLICPDEMKLLADKGAAVAYCPVATCWKGNAVSPALMMDVFGIRVGLGTDGTRNDAFRLVDMAEAAQRIAFGLAVGDSSCGGGARWLHMGSKGGASALGLGKVTGSVEAGLAADFLIVNLDVPELIPAWDLPWDLVRLGNKSQIETVFVDGRMRLRDGWPVDWDARALMNRINELAISAVSQAPIKRVHGTSAEHAAFRKATGI